MNYIKRKLKKAKWKKLLQMRKQFDVQRKISGVPLQKKKKIHKPRPRILYGYNTGK